MNKILVVEDSEMIIKGLEYTLKLEGFGVVPCRSKEEAEKLIGNDAFDLVLLDIMLPDGSGYDVCSLVREYYPDVPVIFLTAKEDEEDVVHGFDLGADDYIIKPFRSRELISRINNVLRRYNKDEREISCGNITLDLVGNIVYKDGAEVPLTALELKVITLLFQNRGLIVSREKILDKIWDCAGNVVNDNTLTVYIKRLRDKLGEDVITTVKGLGYRVDA